MTLAACLFVHRIYQTQMMMTMMIQVNTPPIPKPIYSMYIKIQSYFSFTIQK